MIEKKAFLQAMSVLSELFEKQLSNTTMKLYYKVLSEKLTTEQFMKAVEKWIETGKFFPKPSELIEVIEETEGNTAEKAWLELLSAIEKYGYYRQPYFNDKTIYAVVQAMGGWEAMCNMPTDRQNFYMKEFINLYNQYKNRPEVIENALPAGREADRKALANVLQKAKALAAGREN